MWASVYIKPKAKEIVGNARRKTRMYIATTPKNLDAFIIITS